MSGLRVEFPGGVRPVRGISFTIGRGEAVGVVGESGSGKSLTALAVARLLEPPADVSAGRLSLLGQDLLRADLPGEATAMTRRELRRFLGIHAGLVFQDPMTSFNPVKRVGRAARRGGGRAPRAARRAGRGAGGGPAARGADTARRSGGPGSSRTSCPAACGSGR